MAAFWATALAFLALIALCSRADGAGWAELPIEDGKWDRIEHSSHAATESAVFSIGTDSERGPYLSVGPRRQGNWIARFLYREPLPYAQGALRGLYRTEGIGPYGVAVTVEYLSNGKRLATRSFWLGAAPEWRQFELTFRVSPAGADSVLLGFGLSGTTEGWVRFADLAVTPEAPPLASPSALPPTTRAAPPSQLAATGFYRAEQIGGTY